MRGHAVSCSVVREACIETSLRVARDILGGEILDCSGMESWPKGRRGGDEGL